MQLKKLLTTMVLVVVMTVSAVGCSFGGSGNEGKKTSESLESLIESLLSESPDTSEESLESVIESLKESLSESETESLKESLKESSSESLPLISDYGTLDRPLTVDEALKLMNGWSDGDVSQEKCYVEGEVIGNVTFNSEFGSYTFDFVSDSGAKMNAYSIQPNGFDSPKAGDHIVLYGYLKLFKETYEVSYLSAKTSPTGKAESPVIVKMTKGSGEQESTSSSEKTSESSSPLISDYGTLDRPLTVDEALDYMNGWTSGQISDQRCYVGGTVSGQVNYDAGFNSYTFNIKGKSGYTMQGYSVQLGDFTNPPESGDYVVIYGYLKLFAETYEVAFLSSKTSPTGSNESPYIKKIVKGGGEQEHESSSETTSESVYESTSESGAPVTAGTFTFTCQDSSVMNYYNTIGAVVNNNTLKVTANSSTVKANLRTLINKTKKNTTYDFLRDTGLPYTDAGDDGKIVLFYSHKQVAVSSFNTQTGWNREHVWPKSKGWFKNGGAGADIHHIRPENPSDNTSRGNKSFGESNSTTYFYPNSNGVDARGDVARILFYMATRYSEVDSSYPLTKVAQSVSMLVKWNIEDPVDNLEKQRNDRAYELQGNRNPFIDCPQFATYIWG